MDKRKAKKEFIKNLIEEFKSYALDDIAEGHADGQGDHFEFLRDSFENFVEDKIEDSWSAEEFKSSALADDLEIINEGE